MRYLTTAFLLLCLSQYATAQNSVKKIVLINGVATEVELTESGDIEKVIDIDNNYMSDYELLPAPKLKPVASSGTIYTLPKSAVNRRAFSVSAENYASSDNEKRYVLSQHPIDIK